MNRARYYALRHGLRKARRDDREVTASQRAEVRDPYRDSWGRVTEDFHEYERSFIQAHRLTLADVGMLLAAPDRRVMRLPPGPRAAAFIDGDHLFPRMSINKRIALRRAIEQMDALNSAKVAA